MCKEMLNEIEKFNRGLFKKRKQRKKPITQIKIREIIQWIFLSR